jgi:hypothetical protein
MNPDPGRAEEAGSSPHPADAEAQLANNVMLAEYAALRAEVDRRTNVQWNVVALQDHLGGRNSEPGDLACFGYSAAFGYSSVVLYARQPLYTS